ncbi:hypothetical protein [Dichotomicrobium thermohalophilum]|uniref:Fimbrial protein n=1 Tax=Dichotomicrobium thermohalophilum TaxID=933063 RepID=A0A397Q783_9HYPH|nr:hypothetical protein [Dichotomicrobium thermohalophilum]RIA56339.1 hypothetical protein BXY53_1443 [Dichotomicrobium thermohalophilum]
MLPGWPGKSLALAMAATALLPAAGAAQDACDGVAISGAPRISVSDPYNPFAPTDLTEVTTVTIANTGDAPCPLAVVFTATDGGRLRNAGKTLAYALETLDGTTLLNPPSLADPEAGQHLDLTLASTQAASLSIRARLPAQQTAPPGSYVDSTATIRLYYMPAQGFPDLLSETPLPVAAEVAAVCRLTPPQQATLDFTEDIGADVRPQGEQRGTRLPEAACNTGARLKLEGKALTREGGTAPPGFDDFIDMEAHATFQSVTAMLLTEGADQPVLAESPQTTPDGTVSPVELQVRLRAGQPLAAGSYQSVLTIAVEPSF